MVVVGIGERGSVFERGFVRPGHPLYPLARDTQTGERAKQLAEPALVVIAVAEKGCHQGLKYLPQSDRDYGELVVVCAGSFLVASICISYL